ncbi:MAG TPA: helix-turn-helix domain-containing protein, partial [Syntrophales bacterium]|nr:helix-turn-helix domain-containing protein [Syntrophales bacterium]
KNGVCPYFSLFFPNLKMANFCLDNWGRFNEKEKEIMTVKQVAEYLQMDEHTIYKLARSGQIPAIKIAGQWRFKKVDK